MDPPPTYSCVGKNADRSRTGRLPGRRVVQTGSGQVTCPLKKARSSDLSGPCPLEWGHSGVSGSPVLPHVAISVGGGDVGGGILGPHGPTSNIKCMKMVGRMACKKIHFFLQTSGGILILPLLRHFICSVNGTQRALCPVDRTEPSPPCCQDRNDKETFKLAKVGEIKGFILPPFTPPPPPINGAKLPRGLFG